MVTHNRGDFVALSKRYQAEGQSLGGIVILVKRGERELAERLDRLLNRLTADELQNQLLFL